MDSFKIKDYFKETKDKPSIPIFVNCLQTTPKLTIAIPTYKRAKYLKETIESTIHQDTDIPYEIIVVDNNPVRDDETENLMQEYKETSNVSYYKNTENLGMTGNWNRLYELSRTEWVTMIHDDDKLLSNFLSTILGYKILTQKFDVIFPSYTSTDDTIEEKPLFYFSLNKWDLLRCNTIIGPPVGMTIKKDCILKVGGFNKDWYPESDYELYCRLITNNYHLCKIYGSPICFYRIETNESLKEETLWGFYEREVNVHKLLTSNLLFPIKKFWDSYKINAYIHISNYWLESLNSNSLKIIELNKQLKSKQTFLTKFIFKAYNFYWNKKRIIFRQRVLYKQ